MTANPPPASLAIPRLEVHAVDHCNLACHGCSHVSPFATKRSYSASEYVPWLDRLRDLGARPSILCVVGGEPFLNRDLAGFVAELDDRAYAPVLEVMTNLFWLRSEADLDRARGVLGRIDVLVATYYAPFGGAERQKALVHQIPARHPRCRVHEFHQGRTVSHFGVFPTHDEPGPIVVDPAEHCGYFWCTQVWADGRLSRCAWSRGVGTPGVARGWAESEGLFLDLKAGPVDRAALGAFLTGVPRACHHCGIARGELRGEPWRSVPRRTR